MYKKGINNILLILSLVTVFQSNIYAKSIPIQVDSILNHITDISEIEIIKYFGDSIMIYVDLKNKDTLQLDCAWKESNESFHNIIRQKKPSFNSWEGTFPKVGEVIVMLRYEYYRERILFSRKRDGRYRFWDAWSIPFANSVFFIRNTSIYKPTENCEDAYHTDTEIYCSDGFLIDAKEFEKLAKKFTDLKVTAASSQSTHLEQSIPIEDVFLAMKTDSGMLFMNSFSKRIINGETDEGVWLSRLDEGKSKFEVRFGSYELSDFTYDFDKETSKLVVFFVGKEVFRMTVVKEKMVWKLDEK